MQVQGWTEGCGRGGGGGGDNRPIGSAVRRTSGTECVPFHVTGLVISTFDRAVALNAIGSGP